MNYITTSRKPSDRVRTFAKQLSPLFESEYIIRGKNSISDLIAAARYNGINYILIVTEKNGNPKQLLVIFLDEKVWEWKNTYFIKLLRTRSEILKENVNIRITNFNLSTENRALKSLLKTLRVNLDENSDIIVKDIKKGISIFKDNKEIGPVFDIEYAKQRNFEE